MDTELDLRPYIGALVRRWRFILAFGVVGLIGMASVALFLPASPSATGSVLIVASSAQLAFDPRFTTRDATQITNAAFQRQALIGLASSPNLEALTLAELPPEYTTLYAKPGNLLDAVDVTSEGDLLSITASAPSEAQAKIIAETWGRTYQKFVNQTYSGSMVSTDALQIQIDAAHERYEQAQANLVRFLDDSRLEQIEIEIRSLRGLLDSATNADRSLYSQLLTRTQELDLILNDAGILRDQLALSTPEPEDSIAALVLRARAAGGDMLPVTLRLETSLLAESSVTVAELDRFIATVTVSRDALLAEAQRVADTISGGGAAGYALPLEQRVNYEQRLQNLIRDREAELGRRAALEQQRQIALSSLEVLQRRADEQAAAQSAPEAAVRFIGVYAEPPPSMLRRALILGMLGAVLALVTGAVIVLFRELLSRSPGTVGADARVPRPASDRPVERPVGD